jgi:hypothetical protein
MAMTLDFNLIAALSGRSPRVGARGRHTSGFQYLQ